jgi:hypothetical protein
MTRITWAARDGDRGASQDRIYIGDHFAMVLDGASSPDRTDHDGGWYATALGECLTARLRQTPNVSLDQAVRESIAAIATQHGLTPGSAPSATLAIVRWSTSTVEAFVLGDSPVAVEHVDGRVEVVRDDRLAAVAQPEHQELLEAAARHGFGFDHPDEWRALVDAQRRARNQPGGYWIAEATPEAADHAVRVEWPTDTIASVLLVTDGVAAGPETYGVPPSWTDAIGVARANLQQLVDAVHEAEASDANGRRWPRSKRHDDKAAVFVDLDLRPIHPDAVSSG